MVTPPSLRVFEYFAHAYRRTWRASIMTTFVNPVLYEIVAKPGDVLQV